MIKLKSIIIESVYDNPNFKRWFGNSKVVDSSGKPRVVYHGTNQPIKSFSKSRRGMSTASPSSRKAFYFTDNPDVAHVYAAKAGETLRPNLSQFEKNVKILQKKIQQLEKRAQITGNWEPYEKAMEEYEAYDIDSLRTDDITGQNIIPVFLKIENPIIRDCKDNSFQELVNLPQLIDFAISKRYDGIILTNVMDPPPHPSTHYIVFKPNQIKSAVGNSGEFNPTKSDMTKE